MLEGMKFAVGATIIARRSALRAIGGFPRLKEYLAEDFVMGKFAAEAGHGVILSSYVVENHTGSLGLRHNAAHRLRWVRSTRRSRPAGYLGQLFTMPFPLALLVCIADPSWWPALPLTLFVRGIAAHVVSARVLRTRINWFLLPLEDLAGFGFWLVGFFGSNIAWRGRRYRLYSDGRFELLGSETDA
jgi:ceramide glucosyltransferase